MFWSARRQSIRVQEKKIFKFSDNISKASLRMNVLQHDLHNLKAIASELHPIASRMASLATEIDSLTKQTQLKHAEARMHHERKDREKSGISRRESNNAAKEAHEKISDYRRLHSKYSILLHRLKSLRRGKFKKHRRKAGRAIAKLRT